MYAITTEREYPADMVQRVIAMALSVDPATVVMIQSVDELARSTTGSTCCLLTRRGGQFAQTMEIYPSSRLTLPEEELARTVCVVLNCRALISGEGANPYAWNLVDQHGSIVPVFVEPEALDDRNEFVLAQKQGGDESTGVTSITARQK